MPELQNYTQLKSLLVYENDESVIALLRDSANALSITISITSDFSEFKDLYNEKISMVYINLIMPEHDGIEALRFLHEIKSKASVIISSGEQEKPLKAAARLAQSYELLLMDSLQKPFTAETLTTTLKKDISKPFKKRAQRNDQFTLNDVRRCIAKNEILVMYQPKIDLKTLQFVSAEALVRWRHPDLGILGPGAFLPLVEELNLIGTMTTLIVEKAFKQIVKWEEIGIHSNIAINLSARSFTDLSLPDQLILITDKYNIAPQRVTLEITESWSTQDTASALDIMTRLRLKGFKLSIDDFGTGYSSMTQLKQVPFTELKLDQSFVRGAADDEQARIIVETCIALGHRLGLHVVAEGVETQSDWDLVTELGCDEIQGYYVARPMPGSNIPAWLKRWNRSLGLDSTLTMQAVAI